MTPESKGIPILTELVLGLAQIALNARIETATLRQALVENGITLDPARYEMIRSDQAQAILAEYADDSYFDRVVRKAMRPSESGGGH